MLGHWYFGCCVNLSRKQMDFLLAAMKVMEQPEDDYSLLKITYRELTRTDIWTRTYALATAFEARRTLSKPIKVVSDLTNLCESFSPYLTESLNARFGAAASSICRDDGFDKVRINLAALAEKVLQHREPQQTSSGLETPYLDSETFLPENLLLSMLVACKEEARNVIEQPAILTFLEQAQKEKFGRLSLILATRLMLGYPKIFSVSALQAEFDTFGRRLAIEPDLANIEMKMRFLQQEPSEVIDISQWFIKELFQITPLYRPATSFSPAHNKRRSPSPPPAEPKIEGSDQLILERQGLPPTASGMNTWASLCRYWAWLKNFTNTAPDRLASMLKNDWHRIDFSKQLSFRLVPPPKLRKAQYDRCIQAYGVLADIFGLPINIVSESTATSIDFPHATNLLFSPWIPAVEAVGKQDRAKWEKVTLLPPTQGAWLRMALSSWVAADLVRKGDAVGRAEREFLARYIAHSATHLTKLQKQFNIARTNRKLQEFQDLDEWHHNHEALMIASRDYVMRTGAALYKNATPDLFISSPDKETSLGCIGFLEYGYAQGEGSEGFDRWAGYIPELLRRFGLDNESGAESIGQEERMLPALLRRFLLSEKDRALLPQDKILSDEVVQGRISAFFQWEYPPGAPPHRKSNQRWLLLLNREVVTKKIKESFRSFDMTNPADQKGTLLLVSALQYLTIQVWDDQDEKEYWRQMFLDALWQVDDRRHADRFLRLLLLESLHSPEVVTDETLQRAMAFFILEWGTAHDLKILIERMFLPGQKKLRLALSTTSRKVNGTLFKALLNYRGMLIDDDERVLGAVQPWHIGLDIKRQEVVDQGLAAVIYSAWSDYSPVEPERGSGYLLQIVHEHERKQRAERHRGLSWHSFELSRQVESGRLLEVVAQSVGVVADPANDSILWLHDPSLSPSPAALATPLQDTSTLPVLNLFTCDQEVLHSFYNGIALTRVVAVVLESTPAAGRDAMAMVKFNIGATKFWVGAQMPNHKAKWLRPGDCGMITIEKDPARGWKYHPGTWQKHAPYRPDYDTLTLTYQNKPGRLPFQVMLQEEDITDSLDLEVWSSDISGLLKRAAGKKSIKIFCRCQNKYWKPCPSGPATLIDSLWQRFHSAAGVLSFVQKEDCEEHSEITSTFWRLALGESEHFLLGPADFSQRDAAVLEETLSGSNICGLLIAIQWNEESRRFQLLRSIPEHDSTLADYYPDLELPIDRRNLLWHDLFKRGDRVMAITVDGAHVIELQPDQIISGFPDRIVLAIDKHQPRKSDFEAEITDWSKKGQRCCLVNGNALFIPKSMLSTSRNPQKLLSQWININKGDVVELGKIKSFPDSASIRKNVAICETNFGATVRVEAHSLSMWPLKETKKPNPDPALGRLAELTRDPWRVPEKVPVLTISGFLSGELPGELFGIITRLPNQGLLQNKCEVYWQIGTGFQQTEVEIPNWNDLKIYDLGAKILGKRDRTGNWSWKILQPRLYAKALWRRVNRSDSRQRELYVDVVRFQEMTDGQDYYQNLPLAELAPGSFQILEARPVDAPFSMNTDGEFIPGFSQQTPLEYYRVTKNLANLKWENNWLSVEVDHEFNDHSMVYVKDIDVSVRPASQKDVIGSSVQNATGYYSIITKFKLSLMASLEDLQIRDARRMAKELTETLTEGKPVKAEIRDGVAILRGIKIPSSGKLQDLENEKNWTDRIKIEDGHLAFISHIEFEGRDANVFLYETAGACVAASCKRVKPIGLVQYLGKLKPVIGVVQMLPRPLYYVGPQSMVMGGDSAETKDGEQVHLFEWDYGCLLAVSEKHLYFQQTEFADADLAVWYGDKIISAVFKKQGNIESDENVSMDIDQLEEYYDSHELYRQSEQGVLHHMELTWHKVDTSEAHQSEVEFELHRVYGLENRKLQNLEVYRRAYDRVPLSLLDETRVNLRSKLEDQGAQNGHSFSIMVKLETSQLKKERGIRIPYRYIAPSLDEIPVNSVVLLKADSVRNTGNDLQLEFSYPSKEGFPFLDEGGARNQLRQVVLLRRQFSARQDRLSQVKGKIEGTLLPVSLSKPKLGFDQARGMIINKTREGNDEIMVPLRHPELVEHLLQKGVIFALLAKEYHVGDNMVWMELYPSVFVKLDLVREPEKYFFAEESHLRRGDKILLSKTASGGILIKLAASGHRSFISRVPRPSVILPHNKLLWPFQEHKRAGVPLDLVSATLHQRFLESPSAVCSLGGLPDIEAHPLLKAARGSNFMEWMGCRHPKIAMISEIGGKACYLPVTSQTAEPCLVGYLDLSQRPALHVRRWQFETGEGKATASPEEAVAIDWQDATFSDEPGRNIAKRIEQSHWRYHDQKSAYWTKENSEGQPSLFYKEQALSEESRTPASGPIFFQRNENGIRLRYTSDVFRRFAFPVDELLNFLRRQPRQDGWVTVALAESSGLWVEIAPGRVAELPGAMCWCKPAKNSNAVILDCYDWQTFAPGDCIKLKLTTGDTSADGTFALERFHILKWDCGPRHALSSDGNTCFMPVLEFNDVELSVRLGGGGFTLTLPASEGLGVDVAFQEGDESFRSANGKRPRAGDVVLLEFRNPKMLIAGYPEYRPQPDQWQEYSSDCTVDAVAKVLSDFRYLSEFLQAVGNFLPVTVVSVEPKTLKFDTSGLRQAAQLLPGKVYQAHICGWLPTLEKAVLRIGSKFKIVGLAEVVSGIPADNHRAISDALIEANVTVWLQADPDGAVHNGLPVSQDSDEFEVEAVTSIVELPEESQRTVQCGVVCRDTKSGKLVWLSIEQASLASHLTPEEWQKLLAHPTLRKMKVSYLNNRSVSLTRVKSVERALVMYRIGRELPVTILVTNGTLENSCLAWSGNLQSVVRVVECDSYGRDQNLLVEVIERVNKGDTRTLGVTPRGKRRWKVYLPDRKMKLEPSDQIAKHRTQGVSASPHPLKGLSALDDAIGGISSVSNPNKAASMLQQLGTHLLGSLHLEIISTHWSCNPDNRTRRDGEWQRLKEVIQDLEESASNQGLSLRKFRRLKEVLRAVELKTIVNGNSDIPVILPLAIACAVAAGVRIEPQQFFLMSSRCELFEEVLSYVRRYPTCLNSMPLGLLEEHKEEIDNIRKKIQANQLQIKLLESWSS